MQLKLTQRHLLTAPSEPNPCYSVTLAADFPLDYQAGDWLSVQGINQPGLVQQVLDLLKLNPEQSIELRRVGEVTLQEALAHHLELTQLDPAILNKLTRQYGYTNWPDRAAMQAYAERRDIIDLLQAFPSLQQMGAEFLSLLSPLAPRYYSIASSPLVSPQAISLIFKQVVWQAQGRSRLGVTSTWLSQLPLAQTLECDIKPNAHFKLPDRGEVPIIMLAAGTGLAPFIGFMQQRLATQAKGENWLLFGETHRATRFLCAEQLTDWQQQGHLTLTTAFSRDQAEKCYIQDQLWHHRQAWLALWQQGAQLYICGNKKTLALGVEQTIKRIWQQGLNWSAEQSDQAWLQAKADARIQLDVY